MQIRERVADSLIHVRGLWFRATRNAAYIRGIKEFVLEFCTVRRRRWIGGGGERRRPLYNVTRSALPLRRTNNRGFLSHLRVLLWVRAKPHRRERGLYDRISSRVLTFLEMIVDRHESAQNSPFAAFNVTKHAISMTVPRLIMRYASRKSGGRWARVDGSRATEMKTAARVIRCAAVFRVSAGIDCPS